MKLASAETDEKTIVLRKKFCRVMFSEMMMRKGGRGEREGGREKRRGEGRREGREESCLMGSESRLFTAGKMENGEIR